MGKFGSHALGLQNIGGPFVMIADRIDRQAQHFDAALVELRLSLATAPSSVVQTGVKSLGWEKKQHPIVAGPVIEMQLSLGGVGGEIGGGFVDRERHGVSP
jgi:hypothetical protein